MSLTVLLLFIGWTLSQTIEPVSAYYVDSRKNDVCKTNLPFVESFGADSFTVSEYYYSGKGGRKKNSPETVSIIVCAEEAPTLFFTYNDRLSSCEQHFFTPTKPTKWYLPHIHCDATYWLVETQLIKPFIKEHNMIVIGANAPFVFSTQTGRILQTSGQYNMLIVTIVVGILLFIGDVFAWSWVVIIVREKNQIAL